jgi:hypothetical protein
MSASINFTDYPMGHPPILAWLRANELDPSRLLYAQTALIDAGELTVTEFVFEESGAKRLAKRTDGFEAVVKTVTVPLISSPAAHNLFF